jgi:hypothetical protein
MQTFVISNIHRPPLILPYIKDYNPIITLTPDYPYHAIGHFRCFHGHTNALFSYMNDEVALVFEDDCVPEKGKNWQETIRMGEKMIIEQGHEIVSLHCRSCNFDKMPKKQYYGYSWLLPDLENHYWVDTVHGTLVYLISKSMAKKFIDADFWMHGTNIDCWLWSLRHDFCILDPSPFIHDRSQGSILENPKNVDNVIR